MSSKKISFIELESCLNLVQRLIDDIIIKTKMSSDIDSRLKYHVELKQLNNQRDKIIEIIKTRLNETFI